VSDPAIGFPDIETAARRLSGVANRTPVLTSRTLDARLGATVFLKAEGFQRAGAFKFRGAYNRLAALREQGDAAGVVAFSSGNHAGAVALAARLAGVPAVIVMPSDAPAAKLAATREYGAEVVLYDRYTESREEIGAALAHDRSLTLVPPFDDALVMAGQGTAALELIEDAGPLDVLVVPVSGGGLAAGCATAGRGMLADLSVWGVEPASADDVRQSLAAGHRVRIDVPRTIADGLQTPEVGELTFPILQRLLEGIVVVSDDELLSAMAFAFDRLKIVSEPSGVAGLAALLAGRLDLEGKRVGVVLSGANVGLARFVELMGAHRTGQP